MHKNHNIHFLDMSHVCKDYISNIKQLLSNDEQVHMKQLNAFEHLSSSECM